MKAVLGYSSVNLVCTSAVNIIGDMWVEGQLMNSRGATKDFRLLFVCLFMVFTNSKEAWKKC